MTKRNSMQISTKKRIEALDVLQRYCGDNPYILLLKKDVFINKKQLNDFSVEYVLENETYQPREINKIIKIASWYGEKKKEDWNTDFVPEKIKITYLLGETSSVYHCYVKYRQSIPPVQAFIPKKAILTNFLLEDYHNYKVDFDRYDRLSTAKDPNRKLKEHQKEAVQFLLSRKKCILADSMGLGKSCELTVAAIEGNFDSILIICPANLKTTWKDELLWYVPERDITIIEGYIGKTKSELEAYLGYGVGKSKMTVSELQEEARTQTKWRENRFVIINYDILGDFYEIPESRKKEAIETAYNNSPLLQFIANKKSLLIVDEAHELSNMKALRYKIIRDLIKRGEPDSIYLSTGTPITNDPLNYYNLLYLLEENITDDWAFYMKRYCGAIEICKDKKERDRWTAEFLKQKKKMSWMDLTDDEKVELREYLKKHCKMITIQKEPTNLDELRDRTSHIYLRRVKEDLDNFSIKKHVHEVFYSFTPIQWQEYSRLWAEYEAMKTEENPDVELNKQLIEGAIYRNYCANQMIPNTIKMVKKFVDEGHKVVVICCYDEELYTLRDNFGDSCVIYNGKMTPKAKDKAKYDFINNQDKKVMICNLIAAGVGLTLVVSDVMIFNNFDYVYANNVQAEDRIFRIGQKKDVDIYYQMFIGTQYEHVWTTSLRKKALIETVIKKEDEK